MKFRSPTAEPVFLALHTGHTAVVTREWAPLDPIFHTSAFEKRCECDKEGVIAPTDVPVQGAAVSDSRFASIDDHYRVALKTMLERSEEGDFTADGLPNIKAVSKVCGFGAVKEDVLRVYRDMVAEAEDDANAGSEGSASGTDTAG